MLLAYYYVINHPKWHHSVTSDSRNHENQRGVREGEGGGGVHC